MQFEAEAMVVRARLHLMTADDEYQACIAKSQAIRARIPANRTTLTEKIMVHLELEAFVAAQERAVLIARNRPQWLAMLERVSTHLASLRLLNCRSDRSDGT